MVHLFVYLTLVLCFLPPVPSVSPALPPPAGPAPCENHGQIRTFHNLYSMNPGTWGGEGRRMEREENR